MNDVGPLEEDNRVAARVAGTQVAHVHFFASEVDAPRVLERRVGVHGGAAGGGAPAAGGVAAACSATLRCHATQFSWARMRLTTGLNAGLPLVWSPWWWVLISISMPFGARCFRPATQISAVCMNWLSIAIAPSPLTR